VSLQALHTQMSSDCARSGVKRRIGKGKSDEDGNTTYSHGVLHEASEYAGARANHDERAIKCARIQKGRAECRMMRVCADRMAAHAEECPFPKCSQTSLSRLVLHSHLLPKIGLRSAPEKLAASSCLAPACPRPA
jgi:hypothetical protein